MMMIVLYQANPMGIGAFNEPNEFDDVSPIIKVFRKSRAMVEAMKENERQQ